MNGRALVLAAHGSRHEPAVNEQIRAWATAVAARTDFDQVTVAFHQGTPGFGEVLDTISAAEIIVIPLMASAGYYTNTVLPRDLARNRRFCDVRVRVTDPIGTHSDVSMIVAARARYLMEIFAIESSATSLVLVGHGTPRHPASRESTFALADALTRMVQLGAPIRGLETASVFLDDEPPVDRALTLTTQPNVIVLPFLIAAGPHATIDIPRQLGIDDSAIMAAPFMAHSSNRRIVVDIPFGRYPAIIDLITTIARDESARPSLTSATA